MTASVCEVSDLYGAVSETAADLMHVSIVLSLCLFSLQCFDTVGWAAGQPLACTENRVLGYSGGGGVTGALHVL